MVPGGRKVLALLLALLPVTGGCVGIVTDDRGPTAAPADRSLEDLERAETNTTQASSDETSDFVALSLVVELTDSSRDHIDIEEVIARPLPGGASAFVTDLGDLRPGERRSVAALAVPRGEPVDAFTVEIELTDGLGPARLLLDVGSWDAEEDTFASVKLHLPEEGQLLVRDSEAPIGVTPHTRAAEQLYGYMLFDNGRRDALRDFPYVIHAPDTHPRYLEGERLTYELEGADGPVTWTYADRDPVEGERFETDAMPGQHTLEVQVGSDGPTHRMRLHTNLFREVRDTAPVGTAEARVPVEGVNANPHPFTVEDGNLFTFLSVQPAGNVSVDADLDLYLADEDGRWVDRSVSESPSEHLEIRSPLEPGEYTLWIYNARGAATEYTAQIQIRY